MPADDQALTPRSAPTARSGRWLPLILWPLVAYMTGVIIFGKGPTYIGAGPIFWGECVMMLLVFWMFTRASVRGLPRSFLAPLPLLILGFMLLGAVLTYFGFRRYRMDALRDAAVWYYGTFFFVGLYITSIRDDRLSTFDFWLSRRLSGDNGGMNRQDAKSDDGDAGQSLGASVPQLARRSPDGEGGFLSPQSDVGALHPPPSTLHPPSSYADLIWKFLVWAWLAALAWDILNGFTGFWPALHSPTLPGRGVRLLIGSGSDTNMHMALAAALMLLGFPGLKNTLLRRVILVSVVIAAAGLLFTCSGRGVKVAVLGACLVGAMATINARQVLWPRGRLVTAGIMLVFLMAIAAILAGPEGLAAAGKLTRFDEIVRNATSGTAYWRKLWWENIYKAVHRENPGFGLGFGINLGQFNPFLMSNLSNPYPVRSPHNFNMTVFGRMGYVGATVWASILVVGLGTLFVRVRRGAVGVLRYTLERRKELTFWLIMLTATWLNASFGVLMEGPVLGIPFWFFLGFATGRSAGHDGVELPDEEQAEGTAGGEGVRR